MENETVKQAYQKVLDEIGNEKLAQNILKVSERLWTTS